MPAISLPTVSSFPSSPLTAFLHPNALFHLFPIMKPIIAVSFVASFIGLAAAADLGPVCCVHILLSYGRRAKATEFTTDDAFAVVRPLRPIHSEKRHRPVHLVRQPADMCRRLQRPQGKVRQGGSGRSRFHLLHEVGRELEELLHGL
jgi:hypothetical protein